MVRGAAFRVEVRDLGLSITSHVTFGQGSFLLCASVSTCETGSTSLPYVFHRIFEKKVMYRREQQ